MNKLKITKTAFILNVVVLIATIILGYLLICKGIELTSKPVKIFLFFIFIISTFGGLSLSMANKIKSLTIYYLMVFISPIILAIGCVITGNGIAPLHFGFQIIFSTFEDKDQLLEKNNLYIKRSFSLMSNQWYDLVEQQGIFEKKVGKFNAGEHFNFTDFITYDSIQKKYIRLIDSNQNVQIVEIVD